MRVHVYPVLADNFRVFFNLNVFDPLSDHVFVTPPSVLVDSYLLGDDRDAAFVADAVTKGKIRLFFLLLYT